MLKNERSFLWVFGCCRLKDTRKRRITTGNECWIRDEEEGGRKLVYKLILHNFISIFMHFVCRGLLHCTPGSLSFIEDTSLKLMSFSSSHDIFTFGTLSTVVNVLIYQLWTVELYDWTPDSKFMASVLCVSHGTIHIRLFLAFFIDFMRAKMMTRDIACYWRSEGCQQ